MVTLSLPGTANWCCAMASCDHGVSQTPSFSQSHRIWSRFGGSWASNEVDGNVKAVDVSPLAGGQLKFADGGVFCAGGGGGGTSMSGSADHQHPRAPLPDAPKRSRRSNDKRRTACAR